MRWSALVFKSSRADLQLIRFTIASFSRMRIAAFHSSVSFEKYTICKLLLRTWVSVEYSNENFNNLCYYLIQTGWIYPSSDTHARDHRPRDELINLLHYSTTKTNSCLVYRDLSIVHSSVWYYIIDPTYVSIPENIAIVSFLHKGTPLFQCYSCFELYFKSLNNWNRKMKEKKNLILMSWLILYLFCSRKDY